MFYRIIIDIEEGRHGENLRKDEWCEYVDDLWSKDNLKHLKQTKAPIDNNLLLYANDLCDEHLEEVNHNTQESPTVHCDSDSVLRVTAINLTPNDVADYLRSLKLDEYIDDFLDYEIDGIELLDVDDKTLKTIVDEKKDRFKIKANYKNWLIKKAAK